MNATGALTAGGIAAVCAGLAIYLHRRKVWPKTVIILAMLSSLGVSGGILGRFFDWSGEQLGRLSTNATAALFGIGAPIVTVCIMGLALFFALKPKGPGPTKWSVLVAALFVPLCLALGGIAGNVGGAMQDGYAAMVPSVVEGFSNAVASIRR